MTKEVSKEKKTEQSIGLEQKKAINVLLQGVELACKKGAFSLDDAKLMAQAKDLVIPLIKE